MSTSPPNDPPQVPTLESLSQVVLQLQNQLQTATATINAQQESLNNAAASYGQLQSELRALKGAPSEHDTKTPKKNKPSQFSGKGSILSWTTHMENYIGNMEGEQALQLAVSYLSGAAHEWWIVYHQGEEGKDVKNWEGLKKGLITRFDTLNKEKIARDKLARWKQIKDVSTFNDDFQRIMLDIPNISMEEQIDRYTRGLKSYIWKELCTKDYKELTEAMRDAERVEAAHRRAGGNTQPKSNGKKPETTQKPQGDPMEIGNIQLRKLTQEEREDCMKKGLCLRCRQKGHIAKDCPKGKGN